MSATMNKVLVVGATSGIGEAFARRLHALGKQIIITGRRKDRLEAIKSSLGDRIDIRQWDILDLQAIPQHVKAILGENPDLDTVFVNAGISNSFLWTETDDSTDAAIVTELNSNLTAPLLIARSFYGHLVARAASSKPAALLMNSSGLAFVPMPIVPVYAPTKAAIHYAMVVMRQQLELHPDSRVKANFSICEVAPPWVDTALDAKHRRKIDSTGMKPMPLDEFMDQFMETLQSLENGKLKKEVAVGFAAMGASAWRTAFDPILSHMQMVG